MLIRTVVASLLEANVYLLSADDGATVIVDPGKDARGAVDELVAAHGLRPVAVLITHGHADHTWDAASLSAAYGIPVHIARPDAYRLADPLGSLGALGRDLAALAGAPDGPSRPGDVVAFGPDGPDLAGITALAAPGHTEGSTVYLVDTPEGPVALTGDVLFAGSIGRLDLPGGDEAAMAATLRRLATLDPATVVLAGHGPASTIAIELATNPFLR